MTNVNTTEAVATTVKLKWDEANTAVLALAASENDGVVSYAKVEELAETLGTSSRAVGSKLRSLGYEVAKKPAAAATFSDEEGEALAKFVSANANKFTYAEISEGFLEGKFTPKQVQGKILALELTKLVQPAEKAIHVSSFSDADVAVLITLANEGKSIEEIAEATGREVKSLRGKFLSMLRKEQVEAIPHSNTVKAVKVDAFAGLAIETLTVAEIAKATEKTERGVKAMLTRRNIAAVDYEPKTKVEVAA